MESRITSSIKLGFRRFSTIHTHKTAGIIVIGDEILKGQVLDTNSGFASRVLHSMGINLKKISVVGDYVHEISPDVAQFSKSYDYVITTGGVGPTHDDVSFAGVAAAFNEPLVKNEQIANICVKHNHLNSEAKLAMIPRSAKLKVYKELKFPRITVNNVFMFPGIPELFRKAFCVVAKDSFETCCQYYTRMIYLNAIEEEILKDLNELAKLCPTVQIGCYPMLGDERCTLKITIESSDENETDKVYHKMLETFPQSIIIQSF